MIKSTIKIIKKILWTRPKCPVDNKWCAHYDGMFCTMDINCKVLDYKNKQEFNNENNIYTITSNNLHSRETRGFKLNEFYT